MIEVGDKIRRKKSEIDTGTWSEHCRFHGLDPEGEYVCALINGSNNIFFLMNGYVKCWDLNRFEKVKPEICVGDVYKNGHDDDVRIVCVDRKHDHFKIIGVMIDGTIESYTKDGKYALESVMPDYDLILPWNKPETDWTKVEVDTLIEFPFGTETLRRYFSYYKDDHVYYFQHGATSKTSSELGKNHASACQLVTEAALMLRKQHEAIVQLREALEHMKRHVPVESTLWDFAANILKEVNGNVIKKLDSPSNSAANRDLNKIEGAWIGEVSKEALYI